MSAFGMTVCKFKEQTKRVIVFEELKKEIQKQS
jgi:hypothetical protein